ncbi:HepT-like ribonuclease domain-containing protein [Luteimonas huabeiensis]|uniref:HepT-like ribonuclease domain-containing protein n=1 Tax=Luteimonas huabeiensis TaxID=1244513 RepID=UPI00046421D6|nr:DUF86 domain-containing protein [Luteimonas huabeiensis]
MSPDRFAGWLDDMRAAAVQACGYVEGMTREDFLDDPRTQQAVAMNLLIIGEIAAKLIERYPERLASAPQIPWASMKGMRNRIAHGYFEIDMGVVWETVQRALPALLEQLAALPSDRIDPDPAH